MERVYKWDFDSLVKLQEEYTEKMENAKEEYLKEQYQEIIDEISLMLFMVIDSDCSLSSEYVRQQELLDEIRGMEIVPDYSDLTDDLVDELIPMLANLSILPNIKYQKKINMDECISILGDVILKVFGKKHYDVFNEYILSKNDSILLSNVLESASTTTLNVDGVDRHYIAVTNKNNFEMFSNLIHEIGHLFRLVNNEYIIEEDDKLYEFEAYMYQFKILDYMIENNIYREEALVAMLEIFKCIDRVAVLIDASKQYGLKKMFNVGNLKDTCAKMNVYDRAYLENTTNLLEYLAYIYSRNILNYIYSSLFAIEIIGEEDEKKIYNYVINNIGNMNSDMYVKNILDDPISFNGIRQYKEYRSHILSLINKD